MTAAIVRANAFTMPLADNSIDLIVTSPPYWSLRSYRDDGQHYDGQLGSESTPIEFVQALWNVTKECWRVLKPSGSMFMNLGDKYAGSGGHNNSNIGADPARGPTSYNKSVKVREDLAGLRREQQRVLPDSFGGVRDKSLMGLPWRYALGCIDGQAAPDQQSWILRSEIIWDKPNGMPESVTDRVRRSHEQWFHLTKAGTYYAATDEIREDHVRLWGGTPQGGHTYEAMTQAGEKHSNLSTCLPNPIGKLPGSVWRIATDPLVISDAVQVAYQLPDHFAAFPTEWPRRLILGWSPAHICTVCGEGRRPISDRAVEFDKARDQEHASDIARRAVERGIVNGGTAHSTLNGRTHRTVIGYVCACTPRTSHRGRRGDWKEGRAPEAEKGSTDFHKPGAAVPRRNKIPPPSTLPMWEYHLDGWTPPPSRPSVVLDPFAGTGTVLGVARTLGRVGVGLDLSMDYCRLARWRVFRSDHFIKARARTDAENQGQLL